MKIKSYAAAILVAVCLTLGFFAPSSSSRYERTFSSITNTTQKGAAMTTHATGTFEIKMNPQDDKSDDKSLGRMTIEKQWHGGLLGASKGQMLTGGDVTKGSAGYVAIEKFSGTLNGRKGTFILQHSATMTRGEGQLTITVVPDSGTDQLEGLTGKLMIKIADGKHSYDFEYALPQTP
jgi:hypothetical protein